MAAECFLTPFVLCQSPLKSVVGRRGAATCDIRKQVYQLDTGIRVSHLTASRPTFQSCLYSLMSVYSMYIVAAIEISSINSSSLSKMALEAAAAATREKNFGTPLFTNSSGGLRVASRGRPWTTEAPFASQDLALSLSLFDTEGNKGRSLVAFKGRLEHIFTHTILGEKLCLGRKKAL